MYNFEWDEQKNKTNLDKHKLSFEHAKLLFDKPLNVTIDNRKDYRESRYVGVGELDGRVMVVVFTIKKNGTIRIISFRKGNSREQKEYHKNKLG